MQAKTKYLVGIAVAIAVIASLYYVASTTGFFVSPQTQGKYDNFAKCLTEKGVVMYGSKYCPHCQNQKKSFGSSWQYINYVECTENQQLCEEKGVTAVPVWYVGGQMYTGEKSFEWLSSASGCPLQ